MFVYILYNETPPNWNVATIVGVYDHPKKANKELMRLKLKDAYMWQYLKVIRRKVK